MKLCDHRLFRNRPSPCYLTHLHNGSWSRYRCHGSIFVDDRSELDLHIHLFCDETMAEVCPFRQWAPKMKSEPAKAFWIECEACGKSHREEQAYQTCRSWHNFLALYRSKDARAWRPEGTTEDFLSLEPSSELYGPVRDWLWRPIRRYIKRRDGGRCTDCGTDVKGHRVPYEIHHIVPRSRGGTEHPANLRTLCSKCHRRYTAELMEENVRLRCKVKREDLEGAGQTPVP